MVSPPHPEGKTNNYMAAGLCTRHMLLIDFQSTGQVLGDIRVRRGEQKPISFLSAGQRVLKPTWGQSFCVRLTSCVRNQRFFSIARRCGWPPGSYFPEIGHLPSPLDQKGVDFHPNHFLLRASTSRLISTLGCCCPPAKSEQLFWGG